jgi:hypothetical protein
MMLATGLTYLISTLLCWGKFFCFPVSSGLLSWKDVEFC